MKKFFPLVLAAFLPFLAAANAADTATPPDTLVKNVTSEVIEILRNDQALKQGDVTQVQALIKEKALPHFNMRRMTSLAVGKDWRQATPDEQTQLIDAFQTLLIRTYSNALTKYSNQTFTFKPLRASPDATRVQVDSEFRQPGADAIAVSYMLEKTDDGWKVFDVIVAGASLVTNYRNEFSQEISKNGVQGLIKSLQNKNRSLTIEQPPVP